MRNLSYSTRPSLGRKALVGLMAAGVAATVLHSVAGSAAMERNRDSRDRVTESRDVADFTRVQVRGAIELELTAGEDFAVTVRTRENRIEDVTTVLDGDTLVIDMDTEGRKNFWNNAEVEVTISMPTLVELEVMGAVDGELSNIDSEELEIDVRGAADVEIEGTCGKLLLDVRGAGDIDADDLKCADVEVDVKGAGSASVYASESIDARVAGVASISVYGDPKDVRKHSGGLSSISIK